MPFVNDARMGVPVFHEAIKHRRETGCRLVN